MNAVRHITVSIARPPSAVYAFAANPANLTKWASGLAGSIRQEGDHWVADSPMGEVQVRFAETNDLGVLDHDVTLPSGETVLNPVRVLPNGEGSEVVFSLFHLPGVSDADYARDAAHVEKDLAALKRLLEAQG